MSTGFLGCQNILPWRLAQKRQWPWPMTPYRKFVYRSVATIYKSTNENDTHECQVAHTTPRPRINPENPQTTGEDPELMVPPELMFPPLNLHSIFQPNPMVCVESQVVVRSVAHCQLSNRLSPISAQHQLNLEKLKNQHH